MDKRFSAGNGRCDISATVPAAPAVKTYAHVHRPGSKPNTKLRLIPQQQHLAMNSAASAMDGNSSPKLAATFQGMSVNVQPSANRGMHSWPRQEDKSISAARARAAAAVAAASANASAAAPPPTTIIINNRPGNTNHNNSNNTNNNNHIIKIQKHPPAMALAEQYATLAANFRTKPRNKSDEAINDLLHRIPDIAQIFDVQSRIGNGTFSTVLLATLKREAHLPDNMRRKFAIKHHIPTSHPDRIMKELQCMTDMGGTDNVVGIHCCLRCDASAAFVMPYMPHDRFHDFYTKMEVPEIRLYMQNLLLALRHVHKFNVIHRDVKPSNFLYNRRQRQFLLVDFGLAQHVSLSPAAAGLAAAQQQYQQQQQHAKRPREREGHGAGHQQLQQQQMTAATPSEAALGGAVKRIRLIEEPGTACNWNKMPLKPINDIAKNVKLGEQLPPTGTKQSLPEPNDAPTPTQPMATAQPAAVHPEPVGTGTGTGAGAGAAAGSGTATSSKYNTNRPAGGSNGAKCFCFANPTVCINCLTKKEVHASRAGTPGYRPPEVLLKYADQTTAVDVWAAGVIFLSILSSVYPFFKAPNDFVALAEIVTIFGDRAIRKTALALERMVTISQRSKPLNLRKLCLRFRHRLIFSDQGMIRKHESPDGHIDVCKNCDQYFFNCLCEDSLYITEPLDPYECFPASAYDLLGRLLEINPHKRITAEEALNHPFFTESLDASPTMPVSETLIPPVAVAAPGGVALRPVTVPPKQTTRRRATKPGAGHQTPAAVAQHINTAVANPEQQQLPQPWP